MLLLEGGKGYCSNETPEHLKNEDMLRKIYYSNVPQKKTVERRSDASPKPIPVSQFNVNMVRRK